MDNSSFQKRLVEKILSVSGSKSRAALLLQEVLGLGTDPIYRRLACKTPFSFEEVGRIALQFDLSLDRVVNPEDTSIRFEFKPFFGPVKSYTDFLSDIRSRLNEVHIIPDSKFYYATAEIPIFHYFHYRELLAFKLFIWSKTIWELSGHEVQKFDFGLISHDDYRIGSEILSMYNDILSIEVWHLNIVDNTLQQIDYAYKTGVIPQKEDALFLFDLLIELMDRLRKLAAKGTKNDEKSKKNALGQEENLNFDLYYNEMVSTNNTFLAVTPIRSTIYTTYNTPDFLMSHESRICSHTESWFKKVIKKSVSISCHAEKERASFFNNLTKKIKRSKARLENDFEWLE